jgi:sigma-B regulation protein RsbU (phosphoserine phosphatase)
MLEHYGAYATGTARIAASFLDSGKLLEYAATLEPDREYGDIWRDLDGVRRSMGVKYLYVQMPVSDEEFIYLFDVNDQDGLTMSLGVSGLYGDENLDVKRAMETGEPTRALEITQSEYGLLASAYVPLKDAAGVPFAYVGVDIDMRDILAFLRRFLVQIIAETVGIIAVSCAGLFLLIRRSILLPIKTVARKTGDFARDVHAESFTPIEISADDEIGDLADSSNKMFATIREYTVRLADETAKRERVRCEMDMARTIQSSVLPREFPPFEGMMDLDIYASMKPAKDVGGDFYDFFVVDRSRVCIVIADVSGQGVPAALFMMAARTLIKNQTLSGASAGEILKSVNNQLCANNDAGMFVTMFLSLYDREANVLRYANAGHNPPGFVPRDGRCRWLPVERNFILAGMEDMEFVTQEVKIEPGDRIVLYTDGVTDAVNEEGEMFGEDRLMELLAGISGRRASSREIVEIMNRELALFQGTVEQSDDVAILVMQSVSRG